MPWVGGKNIKEAEVVEAEVVEAEVISKERGLAKDAKVVYLNENDWKDQQIVDSIKWYRDRVEKTVKGQRVKNARVEPTKRIMIKKLLWGYNLMRLTMMDIGELKRDSSLPQRLEDLLKTGGGDGFVNTCRDDIENLDFFGRPDYHEIRMKKILKGEDTGKSYEDEWKDEKHDERFIREYEKLNENFLYARMGSIDKIKNSELKIMAKKYIKEIYELYKWALKDAGEIKSNGIEVK